MHCSYLHLLGMVLTTHTLQSLKSTFPHLACLHTLRSVAKPSILALNRLMLSSHWENVHLSMYSRFTSLLCQPDNSKGLRQGKDLAL